MTDDIPFAKSLKNDMVTMLECSTRRSIISTVVYMIGYELKEYNNKKWTVICLGIQNYQVIDNVTKTEYFVVDYFPAWLGESGFGVYKKRAEK